MSCPPPSTLPTSQTGSSVMPLPSLVRVRWFGKPRKRGAIAMPNEPEASATDGRALSHPSLTLPARWKEGTSFRGLLLLHLQHERPAVPARLRLVHHLDLRRGDHELPGQFRQEDVAVAHRPPRHLVVEARHRLA